MQLAAATEGGRGSPTGQVALCSIFVRLARSAGRSSVCIDHTREFPEIVALSCTILPAPTVCSLLVRDVPRSATCAGTVPGRHARFHHLESVHCCGLRADVQARYTWSKHTASLACIAAMQQGRHFVSRLPRNCSRATRLFLLGPMQCSSLPGSQVAITGPPCQALSVSSTL